MSIQRRAPPRRIESFVCAALIASALMIAACGGQAGRTGAVSATSALGQATPGASAVPASPTTPTGATQPSSGETGHVQLALGAAHYATTDAITVTIRNGSSKAIYAAANFTDCSIILIQREVAGSWQPVNLCADGFPHPVAAHIASGAETTVDASPASASSDAQASGTSQWPVGTYRAALTYTSSPTAAFSSGTTTYSITFVVG